jgi:hypothetical protein
MAFDAQNGLRLFRTASVLLLTASETTAMAQGPSARSELEQGYTLRKQGNFVDALPHLLQSYRLDAQLKTLINLADCEEHVGKLVDAMRHWSEALAQAAHDGAADIEDEARRRVAVLGERIPRLTLDVVPGPAGSSPPALRVVLDSSSLAPTSVGVPLQADPGRHAIVVLADGYDDQSFDVILKAGDRVHLPIAPGPRHSVPPNVAPHAPPERSASALGWLGPVGVGVGVVGLGVGAYFGVRAMREQHDANCPNNVCQAGIGRADVLRSANADAAASTVSFVAGGILVAGGLTFWWLAPATPTGRISIEPAISDHAAGCALSGAW